MPRNTIKYEPRSGVHADEVVEVVVSAVDVMVGRVVVGPIVVSSVEVLVVGMIVVDSNVISDVVGDVAHVDVLVVCVGVVVVVVDDTDLGNKTPSAIIVLMQTLANRMPNPILIFGYSPTPLFNRVIIGFFVSWGGLGGGKEGGGGNLVSSYLTSISLYKPS